MQLHYTYDATLDAFHGAHAGVLTHAHLEAAYADLKGNPNFTPTVRVLHDFSRVTEFKISATHIAYWTKEFSARKIEGRRSFLVGSPTGFGIVTFYIKTMLSDKVKVFYGRPAALQWLNEGVPQSMHLR